MSGGGGQSGCGRPLAERVEAALAGAGDLTGEALLEHVRRVCADDMEVVAECEALFGAAGELHPVLDGDLGPTMRLGLQRVLDGLTVGGGPAAGKDGAREAAPERLGRYRILGEIGEGGMGKVYLAEQEEPRRQVALKVIRGQGLIGGVGMAAAARFRAEAQALATLKHPGVAQVYEAATDARSGVMFFAMELVEGPSLTEYVRQRGSGLEEKIELMARVCDAVQHAHQKGVIHRDLKPSNVLVTAEAQGPGLPKVLDFGVAKVTQSDARGATLALDVGRIVGTLGYMSPESLEGRPEAVDTRSDVYSLGVMLHELLTGQLPIDVAGLSITEAARRIRENDPAPLGRWSPSLRGDLAAVVGKALEKDRERRYASAAALAEDLRRFNRHEMVTARTPSTLYAVRKWVRRRQGAAAAVGIAAGALVAGLVGVSLAVVRISAERDRAERRGYAAAVMAGFAAAEAGRAEEAREIIAGLPERERGWEYRHLRFVVSPQAAEVRSEIGPPSDVVVSRGGRFVAGVWASEKVAAVFDARTLREVWRTAVPSKVWGPALSDDGQRLLVVEEGPRLLCFVPGQSGPAWVREGVQAPRLLPDGRLSVAYFGMQRFAVLDAATGRDAGPAPAGLTLGATGWVQTGGQLVSVMDGRVAMPMPGAVTLTTAEVGPGGDQVAISRLVEGRRSEVEIRRLGDGGLLAVFGAGGVASSLAWRADGERLAAIVGGRVNVVDRHGRGGLAAFVLPAAESVAFVPRGEGEAQGQPGAGRLLVTGQTEAWLAAVPAAAQPGPFRFVAPLHERAYEVAFCERAERMVTGDWGSVSMWEVVTGRLLWRRSLWNEFVRGVAVSAPGGLVAATGGRGRVAVLSGASGEVVGMTADRAALTATSVVFGPDGRWLAAGFDDGSLVRVELPEGLAGRSGEPATLATAALGTQRGGVERMALTRDGRWLLSTAGEGVWEGEMRRAEVRPLDTSLRVWDVREGRLEKEIEIGAGLLWDVVLSPDEREAAVASEEQGVVVVDWRRGEVGRRLGAGRPRPSVAWSRDGTRIALGGDRLAVAVLDSRTGETLARLDAQQVRRMAFAPEDRWLATHDGRVQATVFETAWPDDATLERRELARHAMEYLEQAGRADLLAPLADANGPLAERDAAVRRKVAELLARAGEHGMRRANQAAILLNVLKPGDAAGARALEEQARASVGALPAHPWARFSLAGMHRRMGQLDRAEAELTAALELTRAYGPMWPAYATAMLAELRVAQGRVGEARELIERAKAAPPEDPRPGRADFARREVERVEGLIAEAEKGGR